MIGQRHLRSESYPDISTGTHPPARPPPARQCMQEFDDFNEEQAIAAIRVPHVPSGVVAIFLEFNQLQYMSERESIPVFFLAPDVWHMRKPRQDRLNQYINAVQQGQAPPFSIYDPAMYQACPVADRERMGAKVQHLRSILNNMLDVMGAGLNQAPPGPLPPAAQAGDDMVE